MVDKPGAIKPGSPQTPVQRQTPVAPTLQDKEGQLVRDQQQKRISSSDAARLASQAGFQRLKKSDKKGLDIGDSSNAPIPLPGDELDPDAWSQERLDAAQENLTLATAQFGEVAQASDSASLGAALV